MKELETERLRLRYLRDGDEDAIFHGWANDPEVTRFMTWEPHTEVAQTKAILDRWLTAYETEPCYRWGLERKEDSVLIGMIDVIKFEDGAPVIGYCMGKRWWNVGYMTEACQAVTDHLIEEGYPAIVLRAIAENVGSNRVIQKCGYRFVGMKIRPISSTKPQEVTVNCYRLDRNL